MNSNNNIVEEFNNEEENAKFVKIVIDSQKTSDGIELDNNNKSKSGRQLIQEVFEDVDPLFWDCEELLTEEEKSKLAEIEIDVQKIIALLEADDHSYKIK